MAEMSGGRGEVAGVDGELSGLEGPSSASVAGRFFPERLAVRAEQDGAA